MAKIFINGEIGWWANADETKNDLFFAPNEPLQVYIDSVGGSVTDGNAIAALMREHAATYGVEVKTVGIGLVASIATMVLLAGTRVEMDKDAFLMIHNPFADFVSGGSKELRQMATTLDVIKDTIADRYVKQIEKAGKLVDGDKQKTKNLVLQYMAAETWFTAQEALDFGLIDAICNCADEMQPKQMPDEQMQISVRMVAQLKNTPQNIKSKYSNPTKMENITNEEIGLLKRIAGFFSNLFVKNEAEAQAPQAETVEPIAVAPVVEVAETPVIETSVAKEMTEAEMIAELEKKGYKTQKIDEVLELQQANEAMKNEIETLKNSVKSMEGELVAMSAKKPIVNTTTTPQPKAKTAKTNYLDLWKQTKTAN